MNIRKLILPVILIACLILTGWHIYNPGESARMETSTIKLLEGEISKIGQLPSGSEFTLTLTDSDLTKAAEEALTTYKTEITQIMKDYVGIGLNLSNPQVTFTEENFTLLAKVGISFIKVNASTTGRVSIQNGNPVITLSSIDIPVINIPLDEANASIQSYVSQYTGLIANVCSISNIDTQTGQIVANGIKK